MSSVFSRKITMFTFSGCLTGEGTPLKYCTGRKQTKRSNSCRSATLSERMPPPTGVVSGPLIPTRYSRNASTVSSGSHSSNLSFAVWPAKTSNHAIFFLPPYAFSTAASMTRSLAAQISGPVPSPRMNGMIGRSGTFSVWVLVILSPWGGVRFLYGIRWQTLMRKRGDESHISHSASRFSARLGVEFLSVQIINLHHRHPNTAIFPGENRRVIPREKRRQDGRFEIIGRRDRRRP